MGRMGIVRDVDGGDVLRLCERIVVRLNFLIKLSGMALRIPLPGLPGSKEE